MANYEDIIKQSQENINALKEKLNSLDDLYKEIEELSEMPKKYNIRFSEITTLTENYTNSLGLSTKKYIDGNNTILINNFKKFQKEVSRLEDVDLPLLFKELQIEFISKTRADIEVELKRISSATNIIETHINNLKNEIQRLESIDLEGNFDKLQKTLSDIFGAINNINLTLTELTKNQSNILQNISDNGNRIDLNHKENNQLIESTKNEIVTNLISIEQEAKLNVNLLESKIQKLEEKNEVLIKDVKLNRIFQFIGIAVSLSVLIYILVK